MKTNWLMNSVENVISSADKIKQWKFMQSL